MHFHHYRPWAVIFGALLVPCIASAQSGRTVSNPTNPNGLNELGGVGPIRPYGNDALPGTSAAFGVNRARAAAVARATSTATGSMPPRPITPVPPQYNIPYRPAVAPRMAPMPPSHILRAMAIGAGKRGFK